MRGTGRKGRHAMHAGGRAAPAPRVVRLTAACLAAFAVAACAGRPKAAPTPTPSTELARSDSARGARLGVTAQDLREQPAERVEELMEGRFPGVQVTQAGGGMIVRVRGATTVNGDTQPLFVVDGLPVQPGPNGIIPINPRDVARIEVVRDAAQLSSYGVRGGNGVVKITTKRSK